MDFIIDKISSAGPFFLLLGVLIFIHEWGHFIVARLCGVRVETFSIGFGPKILAWKWGDTQYRLSLIPLGGYVKMYGDGTEDMVPQEYKKESFNDQTVYEKIAIVSAGPLMNLFFAFFLFLVLGKMGPPEVTTQIGDIEIGSAAHRAGLRYGDTIKKVNGKDVLYFEDFTKELSRLQNQSNARLEVVTNSGELKKVLAPVVVTKNENPISTLEKVGYVEGLNLLREASVVGIQYDSRLAKENETLKSIETIVSINGQKIETSFQIKQQLEKVEVSQDLKLVFKSVTKDEENKTITLKSNGTAWNFESAGFVKPELMVGQVQLKSPAEKAGVLSGDHILELNGVKITAWANIIDTIKNTPKDQAVSMKVARKSGVKSLSVTPSQTELITGNGQIEYRPTIGIKPGLEYLSPETISRTFASTKDLFTYAKKESIHWVKITMSGFKKLLTGEVSHKTLSGVISIGKVAKDSLDVGWSYFIKMMAIISINLFLLNLLPVPVLDGGHLVFYFIELVTGKPVGMRIKLIGQQVGVVLVLSLVVYTVFNDISRILFSGW